MPLGWCLRDKKGEMRLRLVGSMASAGTRAGRERVLLQLSCLCCVAVTSKFRCAFAAQHFLQLP